MLRENKIITKAEFFRKLSKHSVELIDEQLESVKKKLAKYQGANARESFKKLKFGLMYSLFLVLTVIFSNLVRESYNKRQVYAAIENYLLTEQLKFGELGPKRHQIDDYLKSLNLTQIG